MSKLSFLFPKLASKDSKVITIRVEKDLYEILEEGARDEGVSLSMHIRKLILFHWYPNKVLTNLAMERYGPDGDVTKKILRRIKNHEMAITIAKVEDLLWMCKKTRVIEDQLLKYKERLGLVNNLIEDFLIGKGNKELKYIKDYFYSRNPKTDYEWNSEFTHILKGLRKRKKKSKK